MTTHDTTLITLRKPALVTGASGGIGLEFAKLLAADGHDLVLVARSADKLEALAAELERTHGTRSRIIAADLGQVGAASELMRTLDGEGVELDILINNAGFGLYGPFLTTELQAELDMIQLNVVALTELSKLVIAGMVARKRGRVVNVASTAAFQPGPLMAVYYATKAYVLSLSEALATELEGTGVTVTALCPGPTESGFQAAAQLEGSKLVAGRKLPSSAEVAAFGVKAMARGQVVAVHGLQNRMLVHSVRWMPRSVVRHAVKRVQAART